MTDDIKTTSNQPVKPLPRRHFLQIAWKSLLAVSGSLSLAGLVRYLSYHPYPTIPTRFDLGPFDQLDFSKAMIIDEAQAILVPSGKSLRAYSLICPHLGCIVDLQKDHFACPCHGSKFNLDGSVQKGPADLPLRPLNLEIDDENHLILDTSTSG